LLAALLTGCMVGPDYQRPDAPTPIVYKELAGWKQATPLDTINRGAWWSIYNDPELDQLEDQVVISNQNVKSFEAAYRAAAALVRETQAQLFPTVGVTSSVTRTRSGGGSGGVTSSGAVAGGRGSGSINTQYSVEGSASWTPDIWGKIRRQIESNVAAAQVSAADLANATLSAQATLAIAYVNLRFEDSLQKLLTETVAQFQHALDITRNQYRAGTASSADVVTAQAQLQTTQAQLVGVGVLRGQFEHAIAMLAGHPPADLSIPVTAMQKDVPVVPTGIPSTLLERRPDIAAAERQMQQENALIGVAISAYYPDISLTALAGFAGSPLSQLFTTASRVCIGDDFRCRSPHCRGGGRARHLRRVRRRLSPDRAGGLPAGRGPTGRAARAAAAGGGAGRRGRLGPACGGGHAQSIPCRHGCVYECHYRTDPGAERRADRADDPAEQVDSQRHADPIVGWRLAGE
jgi:NodT family efflux transporter outer membrane factor (OMF) lipoprotein